MSEKIPERSPKLPQGMSVEDILNLDSDSFEKAAEEAGYKTEKKTPEQFRDLLSKSAARTAEMKARQENAPAPPPEVEENTERIRKAAQVGLSRIYFDHVERDLAKADKYAEEADECVRQADKLVSEKKRSPGQVNYLWQRATNFYTLAYQMRAMHEMDSHIKGGLTRERALQETLAIFSRKENQINLREERWAVHRVVEGLRFQLSNQADEARDLYEGLRKAEPLSRAQEMELQRILAQAKGKIFRQERGSHDRIVDAVAKALKEGEIWKTETADGTSGAAEYFSTGSAATSAYSRHSRPRRDMYGSSGGRDDK